LVQGGQCVNGALRTMAVFGWGLSLHLPRLENKQLPGVREESWDPGKGYSIGKQSSLLILR
jgi:hypothetical protein